MAKCDNCRMRQPETWGRSVVRTACPLDCPDSCTVDVTVERGRIVKIDGGDENPVTRGFICAKVRRFADRVYGEDRLLYPAIRQGAKGRGTFARVSWEEALDRYAAFDGPHAVADKRELGVRRVRATEHRLLELLHHDAGAVAAHPSSSADAARNRRTTLTSASSAPSPPRLPRACRSRCPRTPSRRPSSGSASRASSRDRSPPARARAFRPRYRRTAESDSGS